MRYNLPYTEVLARRRALTLWINAVRSSGEHNSTHRWACAAGVRSQTIYRFLNGQTNNICQRNLRKLKRVTAVPLVLD
jgi:hypothetical protein